MQGKRLEMGYTGFSSNDAYENDEKAYAADLPEHREINVPLLRKTLEHITAHPEEWDQEIWVIESDANACGTACCLAGQTVVSLGHPLVWNGEQASFCLADGHLRTIDSVATHALGITHDDANMLFSACNTLRDLWGIANELTDGEIEIPDDLEARSGS